MRRPFHRRKPLDSQGMTLIEALITSFILAIITPAVVGLFYYFTDGMGYFEASAGLKKENEEAFYNLYLKLGVNKRLYQNDANGTTLLSRLDMTGISQALPTGTDGRLPTICNGGSFSAKDSSAVTATAYGNMLLFLTQEPRFLALNALNGSGGKSNVQVDVYKLHCFYLSTVVPNPILALSRNTCLVEWTSAPLADYNMVSYLYTQDPTLAKNVVGQMMNPTPVPTPQQPVTYSVDPSAAVTAAFYALSTSATPGPYSGKVPQDYPVTFKVGVVHVLDPAPNLKNWTHLAQLGGGRIFPNSIAMNDDKLGVPRYTTINGNFPGGFEVGIIGPAAARQVLVRIVHLSRSMKRIAAIDQFQVIECKDIY